MATTKKAENDVASQKEVERVEVHVPRGRPNEDPNVFISVNGVNYLLPKGETSYVPSFVAEEYYRSLDATNAYYDAMEQREKAAMQSAKDALGY